VCVFRATPSSARTGSARKTCSDLSKAIVTTGTTAAASTLWRGRQRSATITGTIAPVTNNAPRTPAITNETGGGGCNYETDAQDPSRDDVQSNELLGRPCDSGRYDRVGRMRHGERHRRQGAKNVGASRWCTRQQRDGRRGHRPTLCQVRAEKDSACPEGVDQRACERCKQRGRNQQRERHKASCCGATLRIGEQEHRDPRAELRESVERERAGLAAEQPVRGKRAQRRVGRRHAGATLVTFSLVREGVGGEMPQGLRRATSGVAPDP